MASHSECLLPVCRLFGYERAISTDRQPVKKEQLAIVIQAGVGVDVNEDL